MRLTSGTYIIRSPLRIGDSTHLHLDQDVTLVRDFDGRVLSQATIVNDGLTAGNTNIRLSGGTITTLGTTDSYRGKHLGFDKVTFLSVDNVRFPRVHDGWTAFFRDCEDVTISNLAIGDGNSSDDILHDDGLHFAGGRRIAVTNCNIFTGDDCIALVHEGTDSDGPDSRPRTDLIDFVASNCTLWSSRANAFKVLVSATYGGDGYTKRSISRVRVANVTAKCGVGFGGENDRSGGIQIGDYSPPGDPRRVFDIAIDGMTLDCSQNSTVGPPYFAGHGLSIRRADRVQLSGVRIDRPFKAALIDDANDVELRDCSIIGPRATGHNCISVASEADCTNVRIVGGLYRGALGHGIQLGAVGALPAPSFSVTRFEVSGTSIENSTLKGLLVWNASDGVVARNSITGYGGGQYGIQEIGTQSDYNLIIANRIGGIAPIYPSFGAHTVVTRNVANENIDIVDSGGFRQTIDGWYQDGDVAGINAEIPRNSFPTGIPLSAGRFRPARRGSVTGVLITGDSAATAGTLTAKVFVVKNGTVTDTGFSAQLDSVSPYRRAASQAEDIDTFIAGDEIYVVLVASTSPAWDKPDARIRVSVEIKH